MRSLIPIVLVSAVAWENVVANDLGPKTGVTTTYPAIGRYEVIQSPLAARWTFRLNRYTGEVDQLVETDDGENAWEHMPMAERPTVSANGNPRFVLWTSGIAARFTFLIDSETGVTWRLTEISSQDSDGTEQTFHAWKPFSE